MATRDYPIIVNYQATHQSRNRMASTVQLTHISSKGCSWRDVDFVYRNAVYHILVQSTLSFTAVAFREISSTAALNKLLLAIEIL